MASKNSLEVDNEPLQVGWREWVRLPELEIKNIKAKVDTGARTSCLHAFSIRPYVEDGQQRVEFQVHPKQRNTEFVRTCTAKVIDQRVVTNSGGHKEQRWVIETILSIGLHNWPIEVTLSSRDNMKFRMLIGRNAIKGRVLVDPSRSYVIGKKKVIGKKSKNTKSKVV